MSLASLPVAASLIVVAIISGILALAFTFGLRRVFRPQAGVPLDQLASPSATRSGAIVALILALAFADVSLEYEELTESIDEVAILVTQVFEDLAEEIGVPDGLSAMDELVTYAHAVVLEDWNTTTPLAKDLAADRGLFRMRQALYTLQADDPETVAEIDQLVDEVARRRLQRLLDHEQGLPHLLWILVLLISFLAFLPLIQYPPSRTSALYVGGYGVSIGFILYGILMFSSPFNSSAPISDASFRAALDAMERECERTDGCTLQFDQESIEGRAQN